MSSQRRLCCSVLPLPLPLPLVAVSLAGWRSASLMSVFQCLLRLRLLLPLMCVLLQEPGPGQFRFPHFYLIGFQKCATTSLFQ